jgi:hypothetical protein
MSVADRDLLFLSHGLSRRGRSPALPCAEFESLDGGLGVPFEPVRQLLLVYQQHGGPWDWSKGLRDQELFDEHARFLDGL